MINSNYGIFRGGQVTFDANTSTIHVAGAVLRDQAGRNYGFGQAGRKIAVLFGQPVANFQFVATRQSELDPPIFTIRIGAAAGQAYIAFDVAVKEIVAVSVPTGNHIVFGRVFWPAGATGMLQLQLDTTERLESRVIEALNPMSPGDMYDLGMDFSDVDFNKPLVSMSILSEFVQGELRSRSNDELHIAIFDRGNFEPNGSTLTVKPFTLLLRTPNGNGADIFRIIDTREQVDFLYDPVANFWDERIYIYVNRDTGVVGSGINYDETLGVLVAYGDVIQGMTALDQVRFVLSQQVGQIASQSPAEIELFKTALPSGFVKPVELEVPTGVENAIRIAQNIAVINGVQVRVNDQIVDLGPAPASGRRVDLLFLEVYRRIEPAPLNDNSFFTPVAGRGFLVTHTRLAVTKGVIRAVPEAALLDPMVESLGENNFAAAPQGHFRSTYLPSEDRDSWAVPIGYIVRYNQDPWSTSNVFGAGLAGNDPTRPDGKKHNVVSLDEVENIAPVVQIGGIDHDTVFGAIMDAVLRGSHPAMFGEELSKNPLQVDMVAGIPAGGTFQVGAPDGRRRQWSALPVPYWVGTNFAASSDSDADETLINYNGTDKELDIKAPTGGELWLGGVDGVQPVAHLTWVETGTPVSIVGQWVVGANKLTATAEIDQTAADYDANGTISISFQVLQNPLNHLKRVPSEIYGCSLDNVPMVAANVELGQVEIPVNAGMSLVVTPIGGDEQSGAVVAKIVVAATGADTYSVPKDYLIGGVTRSVLGCELVTVDGDPVGIKSVRVLPGNIEIKLDAAYGGTSQITFWLPLGGLIANIKSSNLAIDEVGNAVAHPAIVGGGQNTYNITLPKGKVALGFFTYVKDPTLNATHGVFVDGYLYPCIVTGIDRNLARVTLTLSNAEWLALPVERQADWELSGGVYRLAPGSYVLSLPVLMSHAPDDASQMAVTYRFRPIPFIPVPALEPGEQLMLQDRGYILGSNSSVANQATNYMCPITERFPLLSGTLKGVGAAQTEIALIDPLSIDQDGMLPFDGTPVKFDGSIRFGLGVYDPNGGYWIWLALVKYKRSLRLLVYISEDETFVVDNPDKAFLSYGLVNWVE